MIIRQRLDHDSSPVQITFEKAIDYPFHWHDFVEIIMILKGSIKIETTIGTRIMGKGDIDIINVNDVHRISSVGKDNILLTLQIDTDFAEHCLPGISQLDFYCGNFYGILNVNINFEQEKIRMLGQYIGELVKSMDDGKESYTKKTKELLKYLVSYFDAGKVLFGENSKLMIDAKNFSLMRKYIATHFKDKISLKTMADKYHISLYYLSHTIKKVLGISFQDIVSYFRIDYSLKLLLSTDKRISEIALDCGFSAQRYFYKHFKNFYTHGPSEFRRKYKYKFQNIHYIKCSEIIDKSHAMELLGVNLGENNGHKSGSSYGKCLEIDLNKKTKFIKNIFKDSCVQDLYYSKSQHFLYDTNFMACHIIDRAIHGGKRLRDDYISNKFNVMNNLITEDRLIKPTYYAYYLLSLLGNEILEKHRGYVVTRRDQDIQILLYNYIDLRQLIKKTSLITIDDYYEYYMSKDHDRKTINLTIKNIGHSYRVTRYRLSEKKNSALYNWLRMGKPHKLEKYEIDMLNQLAFPSISFGYLKEEVRVLNVHLSLNDIEFIVLKPK